MKILIIGLGSVGQKHIKAVQSLLPQAEIVALRSNIDTKNELGIENIYSFEEIEIFEFDFAIVSNPTSEHKNTISKLITYGFPIFIEKPIFSSLENSEELIDTINSRLITTYVACNLRFLDCIQFLKVKWPLLKNKKLNEVNAYCGSYLPEWRLNVDFRKTYSANAELGGGVHIDLIHEIDYLYWLFGNPKYVSRNFRNQSSLLISSIDYANYLLDYDGFCANIILNYYRKDSKRSLELVFEDETWIVDLLMNKVFCNGELLFSSDQRITDTYYKQMEYFINSIGNNYTFNTVNNAIDVLKICLGK